jgi:hypothetical protein
MKFTGTSLPTNGIASLARDLNTTRKQNIEKRKKKKNDTQTIKLYLGNRGSRCIAFGNNTQTKTEIHVNN